MKACQSLDEHYPSAHRLFVSSVLSPFALQNLPAGGPLRAGGAGDGWPADDRHEQTQRDLLHPVQRGHHVAERAGEWSVDDVARVWSHWDRVSQRKWSPEALWSFTINYIAALHNTHRLNRTTNNKIINTIRVYLLFTFCVCCWRLWDAVK